MSAMYSIVPYCKQMELHFLSAHALLSDYIRAGDKGAGNELFPEYVAKWLLY